MYSNTMKLYKIFITIILIYLLVSCDGGLSPVEEEISGGPGFSGKITFIGEWPADVKLTYVVLFKDPLISALDFNAFNLKYVSLPIPIGASEFTFSSNESLFGQVEPGDFAYLAVAQSTSETLNLNRSFWRVAGVYKSAVGAPEGNITIPADRVLQNLDIVCDFNNPPNQPPGG